jgi:aspartate/methionine/tyrosine aminotransferase
MGEKELTKLTSMASKENIIVINDATYQSLSDTNCASLLSVKGGTKVGAEVYSFAHNFGLPSCSFGFVAGHSEIINGLNQISTLAPQPVPSVYCELAIEAIQNFPNGQLKTIKRRIADSRAEALKLLDVLELEQAGQNSAPFMWSKIAGRRSSVTAVKILYHGAKIMALAGTEFGESGEGFLRFSLTASAESYAKALQRIKKKQRLFRLIED